MPTLPSRSGRMSLPLKSYLLVASILLSAACGARSGLDDLLATSAGGAASNGGAPSTGGMMATGAIAATGGAKATGGTRATGGSIFAISAGNFHTCALVNGGVQCWGLNDYGQRGDNSGLYSKSVPVQVQGLTSGVTGIATRTDYTCALVNGGVQCWGYNGEGQLGNNSTTNSFVPVQVQSLTSGAMGIAAGDVHACALVNGAAKCWGANQLGQLGNNSSSDNPVLVPVQVQGFTSGVTAIAAGDEFTCAVVNGGVQCWGWNGDGELGNNSWPNNSLVPVQVQGLTSGVTAVAAGDEFACAVVNGGAKCWGLNDLGQLGNNSTYVSPVPVQVQGLTSGVTAIATGGNQACALVNGSAYCWGYNSNGQLGNKSITNSSVPVQVQGLTSGVTAIAAGGNHSCAIVNGIAYCWGLNQEGELGNGTTMDSSVPVTVFGL